MTERQPRDREELPAAKKQFFAPRDPNVPREKPGPKRGPGLAARPKLGIFTTTLWEYPSQHYTSDRQPAPEEVAEGRTRFMQGDKNYAGATPSWVIWQLLMRYTEPGELVVDPMCGSGTTIDVAHDLKRKAKGFDLAPTRKEISKADARALPLADRSVDFLFVDPPYSTHIDYSDDPRCIGKLDAAGDDGGRAYYAAMENVITEIDRVLRPGRHMAMYVSDSWRKVRGGAPGEGTFMPIGFELFAMMRKHFAPVDIIAVVRHNDKLARGNWHKAAEEQNFFLRGFNYLFIMKKD
ncbi:MAG: DNA methyltransferase [Phycisphaerae bacterium]|nr:DNA methyltransferase [Phycisphaerae bacterium]